jgi:serine phosphatase RsbU (regulator of sigma subunit)
VQGLNAGHAFPFVWRQARGEIDTLGAGGPALGMLQDIEYEAHEPIALDEGDVVVVYTDGLSEARDPERPDELFGEEGIRSALREAAQAGKDAKGITLHLVEEAMRLSSGAREDDITIVVARRRGPSA